jgi:hypothetical protein
MRFFSRGMIHAICGTEDALVVGTRDGVLEDRAVGLAGEAV